MEPGFFDHVDDVVRSLIPGELGPVFTRCHRRGIKLWLDDPNPPRLHYEAQLVSRNHVDGTDGVALEIGFHAEEREQAANEAALHRLLLVEKDWRDVLGAEAQAGEFLGSTRWRRISDVWLDPDLEDPDAPLEVGARLVDYVHALHRHLSTSR